MVPSAIGAVTSSPKPAVPAVWLEVLLARLNVWLELPPVSEKVWLLDDSAAALDQLRKAGLTFTAKPANKMLLGTIAAAKLKELAALGVVQFVSQDLGTP